MAITKDYLNTTDLGVLATWMQSNLCPKYFESVTYKNNVLTCTDADENVLLTIAKTGVATAYKSASSTVILTGAIPAPFTYACTCANGAMIDSASGSSLGCMLITKTNNNKTAIVYSAGNANTVCRSGIKRVAWGDDQFDDTTFAYSVISGNQTQLVPFLTDSELGTSSFTPDAYYMPSVQYPNIGISTISLDGHIYLTNGYWTILDS